MDKNIYYISFTCPEHLGVRKKNEAQIQVWREAGYKVNLITDCCQYGILFKIFYRYWILVKYFLFKKSPDAYLYFRQTACFPFMGLISQFRSFSYEVNADMVHEVKALSFFKKVIFWFLKDQFIENAKKVFFVSTEISKRYTHINGKSFVFPNCVYALDSPHQLPRGNRVVFVGSEQHAWQGVDYLFNLIKLMPDYEFHLLGDISHPKCSNVIRHGVLNGEEYVKLIKKMDYAVGTLAFDRSGLSEGSPLKVRDYIRFDLPTVVGYEDSDFFNSPFILKIGMADLRDEVSSISHFFDSWRDKSIFNSVSPEAFCQKRELERARLIVGELL